jgi:hypothetical protein
MTTTFPAVVFLIGAIAFFNFAVKLRHFKVREKPPASRAHVSLEERQRRVQIERWIWFCRGLVQVGRSVPFDGLRIQAERLPTRGMIDRML